MSDSATHAVRDAIIASAPQHESVIRTRDEVAMQWCTENGVAMDDLTSAQVIKIRSLPEWQDAR
ncbi:MAG: hypothetical protein ACOH18_01795 [Candidatus Saccharimonadaceae bacterium]